MPATISVLVMGFSLWYDCSLARQGAFVKPLGPLVTLVHRRPGQVVHPYHLGLHSEVVFFHEFVQPLVVNVGDFVPAGTISCTNVYIQFAKEFE
jgi:hypothetical protein